MPAIVMSSDTWKEMAEKIYREFDIGQSCAVIGFIHDEELVETHLRLRSELPDVVDKGQEVWDEIQRLDKAENFTPSGRRKVRYASNSTGAPIANKCFKHQRVISDAGPKWTIWRIQ